MEDFGNGESGAGADGALRTSCKKKKCAHSDGRAGLERQLCEDEDEVRADRAGRHLSSSDPQLSGQVFFFWLIGKRGMARLLESVARRVAKTHEVKQF